MLLETTFCLLRYVSVCIYAVCLEAINILSHFHSFILVCFLAHFLIAASWPCFSWWLRQCHTSSWRVTSSMMMMMMMTIIHDDHLQLLSAWWNPWTIKFLLTGWLAVISGFAWRQSRCEAHEPSLVSMHGHSSDLYENDEKCGTPLPRMIQYITADVL